MEQVQHHITDTSRESSELCQRLEPHARMFEQLHEKVSEAPITTSSEDIDQTAILQTIVESCATTVEIATLIAHLIVTYLVSRQTPMKALRASAVFLLTGDSSWPVVEWVECDGRKNIAIFHFEDQDEPEDHSWIMHSGVGPFDDRTSETRRWRSSRLDWNVGDISHLKTLFKVAQHLLGVLEWPTVDAYRLYCEQTVTSHSIEEYIPTKYWC
jgi:hypothetical protein